MGAFSSKPVDKATCDIRTELPAFDEAYKRVETFEWSTSASSGTVLKTYRVPWDLLTSINPNTQMVLNWERFTFHTYSSCDVLVVVTGSVAQAGLAILGFVPGTYTAITDVKSPLSLSCVQKIVPHTSEMYEMSTNFIFHRTYLNANACKELDEQCGHLFFQVLEGLFTEMGNVTISLYVKFEGHEFLVPRPSIQGKYQLNAPDKQQPTETVSGALSSVAGVVLGSLMTMDRPPEVVNPTGVLHMQPSMCNLTGPVMTYGMQAGGVALRRGFHQFGVTLPETSIKSLAEREHLLCSKTWGESTSLGSELVCVPLCPMPKAYSARMGLPDQGFQKTVLEQLADLSCCWWGDLIFKFYVNANNFHTGSLRVGYYYGTSTDVEYRDVETTYNSIWNISNGNHQYVVRVPANASQMWLSNSPGAKKLQASTVDVITDKVQNYVYGFLKVFVNTSLRSLQKTGPGIKLFVSISADLRLNEPRPWPLYSHFYTSSENNKFRIEDEKQVSRPLPSPAQLNSPQQGVESTSFVEQAIAGAIGESSVGPGDDEDPPSEVEEEPKGGFDEFTVDELHQAREFVESSKLDQLPVVEPEHPQDAVAQDDSESSEAFDYRLIARPLWILDEAVPDYARVSYSALRGWYQNIYYPSRSQYLRDRIASSLSPSYTEQLKVWTNAPIGIRKMWGKEIGKIQGNSPTVGIAVSAEPSGNEGGEVTQSEDVPAASVAETVSHTGGSCPSGPVKTMVSVGQKYEFEITDFVAFLHRYWLLNEVWWNTWYHYSGPTVMEPDRWVSSIPVMFPGSPYFHIISLFNGYKGGFNLRLFFTTTSDDPFITAVYVPNVTGTPYQTKGTPTNYDLSGPFMQSCLTDAGGYWSQAKDGWTGNTKFHVGAAKSSSLPLARMKLSSGSGTADFYCPYQSIFGFLTVTSVVGRMYVSGDSKTVLKEAWIAAADDMALGGYNGRSTELSGQWEFDVKFTRTGAFEEKDVTLEIGTTNFMNT